MGQLVYPKRRLRQQPRWPVEIDWSHPLSEGLIFYSIGMQDLVSGAVATPVSAWGASLSSRNHGIDGLALESHSVTNGGFEYAGTDVQLLSGLKFATVVVIQAIDSVTASTMFMTCPIDDTTWVDPFVTFAWGQAVGGTQGRVTIDTGGVDRWASSSVDYLIFDGSVHMWGANKTDGTAVEFFRDGAHYSTNAGSGMGNAIVVTTGQNSIYTLSRNTGASAGGVNGRLFLTALWKRRLRNADHQLLYANPWAMLKPRVPNLYYILGIPATRPALNRASSMHFQRHYEPIAMGV